VALERRFPDLAECQQPKALIAPRG
jgi:hypothetical protein